jgi:hypothetical protein
MPLGFTGIAPLGQITIATPGTPVGLNVNVGKQAASNAGGAAMSSRVKQFVLHSLTANTGAIYLLPVGFTKANTSKILDILLPGDRFPFPIDLLVDDSILLDNFVLDADVAASVVVAFAVPK